jgi:hypothetical protein
MDALPGGAALFWIASALGTIVLSVVSNLLTEPVRNWIGALSEQRARRRIDTLMSRLRLAAWRRREPWRLQARLSRDILLAMQTFAMMLFVMLGALVVLVVDPNPTGTNAFNFIVHNALYAASFGFMLLGASTVRGAVRDVADVLNFADYAAEVVATVEKLRGRYPSLVMEYPDISEVTEALAQLRPKDSPEGGQRGEHHERL